MIAEGVRTRRLAENLTQDGLSKRSGVPLPTLRKFERTGAISLEALLKLLMVVGGLEDVAKAVALPEPEFLSIDEVIAANRASVRRKRGRIT